MSHKIIADGLDFLFVSVAAWAAWVLHSPAGAAIFSAIGLGLVRLAERKFYGEDIIKRISRMENSISHLYGMLVQRPCMSDSQSSCPRPKDIDV